MYRVMDHQLPGTSLARSQVLLFTFTYRGGHRTGYQYPPLAWAYRLIGPPCPMAEFFALILRSYTHSPQLLTSIYRLPLFVGMCLLLMLTVLHETG
jgi:hypothetical protein